MDQKSSEFFGFLETASLEDLVPFFSALQKKIAAHRADNAGLLPLPVWLALLEMYGSYVCFEALIRVYHSAESFSYALKWRVKNEQGWNGQYCLPGVALRPGDTPLTVYSRLCQEVAGQTLSGGPQYPAGFFVEPAYVRVDKESDRGGVTCLTLVYQFDIHENQKGLLSGAWDLFPSGDFLPEKGGPGIPPEHYAFLHKLGKNHFHKHHSNLSLWFFNSPRGA